MRGLCCLILSLLSQVHASTVSVVGIVGHNVTLPCSYDALAYGPLSFCWGKDWVPTSKCSNTILSSEDGTTQNMWGPRFQLRGAVEDGDVSLTVMKVRWSDAGLFGCRVEIPGWFNDLKVNVKLSIEEEPEEIPVTSRYTQPWTQGMTSASQFETTQEVYVLRSVTEQEFDLWTALGVENMGRLAAVVLVTIILILLFIFQRRLLPKRKNEEVDTMAPENIYESIPMH